MPGVLVFTEVKDGKLKKVSREALSIGGKLAAAAGGELAAFAALEALEHGWSGVHARLEARRRRAFAAKYRFNRALRALVASPYAIGAATQAARVLPGAFRALIRHAGDCTLAASQSGM
jgi:flavin-dependent dehydrogenase